MIFLGTGAAELVPSPFCECELCTKARQLKGKNIKKRSCFMLSERVLIDFGPDLAVACIEHDVILSKVEHIFLTHTHSDHLNPSNLWLIGIRKAGKPITMYMSYEAFTYCKDEFTRQAQYEGFKISFTPDNKGLLIVGGSKVEVRLQVIEPYAPVTIDDMQVFAVLSNHGTYVPNEFSFNYRITTADGTKLLYASDTGLYSKKNLEALSDAALDVLIMEATYGAHPIHEDSSHLNGPHFIRNVEMMKEYGIVGDNTRIYSTHLSQSHDFLHDDMQAYFDKNSSQPITVAYDGLIIE